MLRELRIHNFAIIENVRVVFHPGLNVLTGETGAGKTILISALNLLLGSRADTDFIRSGQSSATVEGRFEVTDPETLRHLEELGIETEDGEILLKRQLSTTGKNRCFVNDSGLTVAALSRIGDRLVDLHGQHDHQALLRPETHVDLLDRYGQSMADRRAFAKNYADYQNHRRALAELEEREKDRKEREDLLQFQREEIDRAGLSPGEEDELQAEKNRLRHAEKLHEAVRAAEHLLADADGCALDQLRRAGKDLEPLAPVDPALDPLVEKTESLYYQLEALTEELKDYGRSIRFDPARLEEIEDRLAEINGLKRKYGADVAAVLERRDRIAAELESLATNEEKKEELRRQLDDQEKTLAEQAAALAEKREKSARDLKKKVEKELQSLSMTHAQFGVRFDYPPDPEGFALFRGQTVRLNAAGLGTLEFLFSPNPGENLRPLAKIASGGELSRVMLALKSILHKQDTVPVMVFDEVDTGIGGRVAETVGRKLKKVAQGKQVFSITHLPQIAGMASAHFRVHKEVKGNRTYSTIRELAYADRVEEIARMSGGEKITETTLRHAREMIRP